MADAYMLNSRNFMLNFINDATFLMKTFIFMLYPHTQRPTNSLCKRQELGVDRFA